ncbi:MAG: cell division protein ZapA [Alphaproteobacteria bacterium]|uniref:cell division protein ZapA n=1 Tax=Pacificispira sp. TaxID=2888761 RepID=UPI001B053B21|nr:cell division protein ZapA [Alphaproteobacteria bacterium]MBO6862283.1 cell division protein ZapA [Alphaproteobacteria bacterium]
MAQVSISINGRPYTVACEDGQEPRLRELAAALDEEVSGLASAIGQVGDTRLLVIAGLSLVDRMADLAAELDGQGAPAPSAPAADDGRAEAAEARAEAAERRVAELEAQLAAATDRISSIAASLEDA